MADIVFRPAQPTEVELAFAIDDDACRAYAHVGMVLQLDDQHPYVITERARWASSARAAGLHFACRPSGEPVGFSAVDHVDGLPFLDQVSVRLSAMRQGIGRMLVERAIQWSAAKGELWLTTYDHVAWNRPWYERLGFRRVSDPEHGPELRRTLEAERAALPAPEQRIAMRYTHR